MSRVPTQFELDVDSLEQTPIPTESLSTSTAPYSTQQQHGQQLAESTLPAAAPMTTTSLTKHVVDEGLGDGDIAYDQNEVLQEISGSAGSEKKNLREPVALEWTDLRFSVGERTILDNVGGFALPGQVLALMGPSGAGKSTLLNMLAGRLLPSKTNKTSGSVLVNGEKRNFDRFRRLSAYVLQEDMFFPELTVRETVNLSALLRLPRDMPEEQKRNRVEEVLQELGLVKCADTKVGNELIRGISGGERKRLNVATELVTDPSLIFLDEPTTGLDSFAAQSTMQMLIKLAKNSRTVIATIHQPRSSIYTMFDMLLLISEGRTMYFGRANEAVPYFGTLGYKCPATFNPADYFIDFLSVDQRSKNLEKQSRGRIATVGNAYQASADIPALRAAIQNETNNNNNNTAALAKEACPEDNKACILGKAHSTPKYANSWFTQFRLLIQRSGRSLVRERASNIAMISQSIFFSILLGLIWLKVGNLYSSADVQAIAGVIFFLLVNQAFSCTFGIIFLFPAERAVVLKERESRLYHVSTYFWSKSVSELPRTLCLSLMFSIVTFFMISLRSGASHFFAYYAAVFLTTMASEGLSYCVSAFANDPQQAGALAPVFIVTSMLFSGFLVEISSIPVWLRWLNYISFLKYGYAAAMQNEFEDRELHVVSCTNSFCPTNGNEVLDFYGLTEFSFWENYIILLALVLGFRIFAYLVLLIKGPKFDLSV